jgi:hypothetical protein
MRRLSHGLLLLLALAGAAHAADKDYAVQYRVRFLPAQGTAQVAIETQPGSGRLIELDFAMPPADYREVQGDGLVRRNDERVSWQPPRTGGTLRYTAALDHARGQGHFDSRITPGWVVTRGDRLVPPVRVRATKGSESSAKLHFELPQGWDDVETAFSRVAGGDFLVTNAARGFDRPVGWIAAGNLATMRETIEGLRVNIAAPKGTRVDHVATLAILRQALPSMQEAFGELPQKLLIVRAGDPMWRGGLSAPGSTWIHAERPLISENGTSPLLHELTHVFTQIRGAAGDDWIAEGLAEFYSLEIGRRAGLISQERFDKAIAAARRSGAKVPMLHGNESTRDRTRKAVALFADLDAELQSHGSDLDALVQRLMRRHSVSLAELRGDAAALQDQASSVLESVK